MSLISYDNKDEKNKGLRTDNILRRKTKMRKISVLCIYFVRVVIFDVC